MATQPLAKELPHNVDAERSVLGAILLDNSLLQIAAAKLNPNDFFVRQHQVLFAEMRAMAEDNIPIDLVSLTDRLNNTMQLPKAGGGVYIAELVDGVPRITHVEHYAQIVKDHAQRREIIEAMRVAQQQALDGTLDPGDVAETVKRRLTMMPNGKNGHGHDYGKLGYSLTEFIGHNFPMYEHLIPGMVPARSNVLLFAKPHHIKSYLTLGLALSGAQGGTCMGLLEIPRPFRTAVIQIEEEGGDLQQRFKELLNCDQFSEIDSRNLWIIDRDSFQVPPQGNRPSIRGFSDEWISWFTTRAKEFKPDLIIYDVMRRFFVGHGDPNSPEDSSQFLEQLDTIRDTLGCSNLLVHHEKKGEGDLFTASSGSGNFAGWAGGAIIRLQRKKEDRTKGVASVEVEVDVKLGRSLPECRLVADFAGGVIRSIRLQNLEDDEDIREIRQALGYEWTVLDLAGHLGVHRKNAWTRMKDWWKDGKIEKVGEGKPGRGGSLARFRFVDTTSEDFPPVAIRRIVN